MLYTPLQVRRLLDIGEQTFRYWRSIIPSINDRRGRSPCFTSGDILALFVVKTLVEGGLNIGQFAKSLANIFTACNRRGWVLSVSSDVVIDLSTKESSVVSNVLLDRMSGAFLIIRLRPLAEELERSLLQGTPTNVQMPLSLPPMPIVEKVSNRHG